MSEPRKAKAETDAARREALKTVARFAVYVAPAMTVLVKGADAHHRPGHCSNGPAGGQCFSPA